MEEQNQTNQNLKKQDQPAQDNKVLEGFGGWLLLLGFGVFYSVALSLVDLLVNFSKFKGIDYPTVLQVFILLSQVWLVYLMVKRKRIFRKWFLGFGIVMIIITGFHTFYAAAFTTNIATGADVTVEKVQGLYTTLSGTILYTIIWNLYLWKSKRSKNTFIK